MTLGIMSAMTEEIDALIQELDGPKKQTTLGRRDYYEGTLWGVPCVIVFSRWGKVAAATTATCLITRFNIQELIFTGVAGGVDPGLRVGDVVLATSLYQ